MCTRYALEKDLTELKDIISSATQSSLAFKFIDTHGRPIVTVIRSKHTQVVR